MTDFDRIEAEPFRYDFFDVMRWLERGSPDKPRIGDSGAHDEEIVILGQDPYVEFPASNLARFEPHSNRPHRILCRFLGLLGPQGPLPLHTTVEAKQWSDGRDEAFARFADLFNHRFLQLFFRAWADSRPHAQHDRPADDRFTTYLGSAVGIGTAAFRHRDSVGDMAKLSLAGLLSPVVKSASRIENMVTFLFGVECHVEQFVGCWLTLESADRSSLSVRHSSLGRDILLGSRSYSVQDKFRICVLVRDLEQFENLLPDGAFCERLADALYFYLGDLLEYVVEIAIPADKVRPARLGRFGRLGWTSWMTAGTEGEAEEIRRDCRFHPAEATAARKGRKRYPG
jgi:type VI secretion system protein ImpH